MKFLIGLSLPDHISSHISTIRGSLPYVHWDDPNNYHIALCFIGEIKNRHILNDLDIALEKISFPSFDLTIQGVHHYTSPTFESYFWASVSPTSALLQLKKKIEFTLHKFDIKLKKQHFIPHISLAKGSDVTEEQISNWLFKYNSFKTEPFQICQFSLLSSHMSSDKSYYETEADYFLK